MKTALLRYLRSESYDSDDRRCYTTRKKGLLTMGKRQPRFSEDEVHMLEMNPYTLSITNNRISVTLAAKKRILELYSEGKTRREIMADLGYDPDLLGEERVKSIIRSTRREAESEKGLHEGYKRTAKRHLEKEEIEQLDESPSSYAKLKNEVIYLREEVEFLKKISQQVISGKRGK